MTISLQRLDQLHKPDTFDDQMSAVNIAAIEGAAIDYADFHDAVLSQFKRILQGDEAGNWFDDPHAVHGGDASLYALYNRATLEGKLALSYRLHLTDMSVPNAQNWMVMSAAQAPDKVIAYGATTEGAVTAKLAGAIGSHSLTEISGANTLKPKNLVMIFDGSTGDEILSSSRRVYALLQVGSGATDGSAFTDAGNEQGQLSFVRPNATYDDLEACPVADIQNLSIVYAFTWRVNIKDMPEDSFRGDIDSADPSPSVLVSLDSAYDGGTYMTVDATDVDIRLSDTKSWVFRKGVGGAILFQIKRTDAGTADEVAIGSAVDLFNVDAAASDFDQGINVDTGAQAINIGTTAAGVIDSIAIETRATTGDNLVASVAGNVSFQTVNEATPLPLDDATAGPISALTGGPYASVSAAIAAAMAAGGVQLTFKTFVAASNYAKGANIPAATLSLVTFTLDANTPANTDLFLFLNGRLLFGGNAVTKNDVYVGTTPASGDIIVDMDKGVHTGDVILSIALQA
jgi:hypothetical protein